MEQSGSIRIYRQLFQCGGFSLLEAVVCTAILSIMLAAGFSYARTAVQRTAVRDAALIRRLIIRSQIAALSGRRTVVISVEPHEISSGFRRTGTSATNAEAAPAAEALIERVQLPLNFRAQIRGSQRSLSSYGTGSASPGTIVLTASTPNRRPEDTTKNHCTITLALRGRVRISCQHV